MKKRILFLISDTGGGHRAAALAISEAIHFLHPDNYELIVEDLWKNHTPPLIQKLPDAYGWFTGPGLPLWKLMWTSLARSSVRRYIFEEIEHLVRDRVIAYYRGVEPDMVVSLHPLMNHIGYKCLREAGLSQPFATVVTDLVSVHPAWIEPQVTRCIVPTEAARQMALSLGMSSEKLALYGQPVSLKFAQPRHDKMTLKQDLGIDPQSPTVLITGGGAGRGKLRAIAQSIAEQVEHAQLLLVTGHNKALYRELVSFRWTNSTRIYGFVENMPELMHASDIIVTKAGPGTISEALVAGIPILLSDYIPGQETGNLSYVESNGVGTFVPNPDAIARQVQKWLTPGHPALAAMAKNAAKLAQPRACLLIAEDLCYVLKHSVLPVREESVRAGRFELH